MVHKNPAQVERLIKRLQHPQFDFYIHIDKKVNPDEFSYLASLSQVYFINNRTDCNWGGNSLFNAILSSVSEVVNGDIAYDFISLISGQDYPIKSAAAIYDFFERHRGKSFISFESSTDSPWWQESKKRYQRYHLTDMKFKGKYVLQRVINKISPLRKFPGSYELYGGNKATWWTIDNACAAYMLNAISKNKKLNRFIKFSWGTDEFIIPTIIMNSGFKDTVINENYRYIDWSEGNAHPRILDESDLDNMMKSNMLFARKFDMSTHPEVLDKIDALQH